MSSPNCNVQDSTKRATSAFMDAMKIPQLSSVRFEATPSLIKHQENVSPDTIKSFITLKSIWSQSSVASGSKINFSRTDVCCFEKYLPNVKSKVDSSNFTCELLSGSSMPILNDPGSYISDYCSEKQLEVLIRKRTKGSNQEDSAFILEVWNPNQMLRSINLSEIDAHGEVYLDGELGGLAINRQGTKMVYIAEEKRPKSTPFFKGYGASVTNTNKDKQKDDEKIMKGQQYRYTEDFGEQMVGKSQSVIVVFDLERDELKVLPRKTCAYSIEDNGDEGIIPKGVCPGLPVWDDNGEAIYGIAIETEPRRLGLIYCSNRKSYIFKLCLKGSNFFDLSSQRENTHNISCRAPRYLSFAEDQYLIWLERDLSIKNYPGPHMSCFRLMKMNMSGKNSPEVVIDVKTNYDPGTDNFAGLFLGNCTAIGKRCIVAEDTIILTTIVNDTYIPLTCNILTGNYQVHDLYGRHFTVHDSIFHVPSNTALVVGCRSSPLEAPQIIIGRLEREENGDKFRISCDIIDTSVKLDGLPHDGGRYIWKTLQHNPERIIKGYEKVTFSSIYVGLNNASDAGKAPLILWPHGGPHTVITTSFMSDVYYFLMLGYSVLLVNYRGSLGVGNDSVMCLPGNVGDADVKDCYQALQDCLNIFEVDPNRICLFGGSHGGFLVTHLAGQYPESFKAVVARNPVINISSMANVTDIPDWCCNEAGLAFNFASDDTEAPSALSKMYLASPVAHAAKVKAAMYLMIGKNDLRVPPSQGYEYYHMLKELNNSDVRMNIYDDCHPLSKEDVHSNVMINAAVFLYGGSHGGFIVLHLASQYPNTFQAVVARNPVVNKATKSQSSDIPGNGMLMDLTTSWNPDPKAMSILYNVSPVAYAANIKVPIYLMIGSKDIRVPPSQGHSYYNLVKCLGNTDVKMNVYTDCHPLGKVLVHCNVMVNTAIFYDQVSG